MQHRISDMMHSEHVDAILARVYKEKLHLVENGKRKTNIFKALSILEIV